MKANQALHRMAAPGSGLPIRELGRAAIGELDRSSRDFGCRFAAHCVHL